MAWPADLSGVASAKAEALAKTDVASAILDGLSRFGTNIYNRGLT